MSQAQSLPAPVHGATNGVDRALWWVAVAAGVAGIALGVAMAVWPRATLAVVALLLGAWLSLHGLAQFIGAFLRPGLALESRLLRGAVGLLFLTAGVLFLGNLVTGLTVAVALVGVAWLLAGLLEAVGLLVAPGDGDRLARAVYAGGGVIAGLAVLAWPEITLTVLVYFAALWTVVLGVSQLMLLAPLRPGSRS
jgi:uncharacterized membrane protein HdeD (DUF308 family)